MRIKCPHCNGKGFSEINSALNLTCGWCMGEGELDLEIVPTEPHTEAEIEKKWENTPWDTDVYLDDIDGKEPLTNEEWLRTATTEQLAEWFGDWHSFSCVFCKHWKNGCIYNHNQVRCAIEEGKSNKELWVEWLKQPHTEKE